MHYLLTTFGDFENTGSTCSIFLSTFHFLPDDDSRMQPSKPVQRLVYKIPEPIHKLHAPYVLPYWTPDHLFLVLPLLSCNPKTVRFNLRESISEAEPSQIETLTNPLYFPNSTPCRNPRILYHSSKNRDVFVLALDAIRSTKEDEENSCPPAILEWKIDSRQGWRAWDDGKDMMADGFLDELRSHERLRGAFIDADRRFNVVVRSGLNWTRKAFLSCS